MSFTQKEDELLLEAVREQPILYNLADKNYKNTLQKDQVWYNIATSLNKSIEAVKARWKSVRDTYDKRRKRLGTGSPRCPKKPWSFEAHFTFLETVENERMSTSNVTFDTDDVKDRIKRKYENIVDNEDDHHNIDDEDNIYEVVDDDKNNQKSLELLEMIKPCPKKIKKDDRHMSTSSVMSVGSSGSRKSKSEDLLSDEEAMLYKYLLTSHTRATENSVDLFFKSLAIQVNELPPHVVPDLKVKILSIICECEKSCKFSYVDSSQQQQQQNLSTRYFQSQAVPSPLMSSSSNSTDYSGDGVTYFIA